MDRNPQLTDLAGDLAGDPAVGSAADLAADLAGEIARAERRLQRALQALADIDAGRLIRDAAVQRWVDSLGSDNELPPPAID